MRKHTGGLDVTRRLVCGCVCGCVCVLLCARMVWCSGQVAALNGTHPQASHAAQITHLAHYRNILISGCQDGSVLAWDPSFPVGPMVMLNDQRYDEGVEVNVIAGLHCVDDESLNAGGSGGPVALAVLYNGGVIVWNLWEMLRLARGARDLRLPAPALDPVATGMMGAEGDRVKDTELTRTDPLPPAVAHWRLLALVVPAGSPSARIRHFTIQEFVIQRKFIEIPMNFLSSMRIAACPYAVCVVGAGLITIIQQSGYGDRGWDAADLLEAASKGGVALDYDDPLAIGDMRNSAPRVYVAMAARCVVGVVVVVVVCVCRVLPPLAVADPSRLPCCQQVPLVRRAADGTHHGRCCSHPRVHSSRRRILHRVRAPAGAGDCLHDAARRGKPQEGGGATAPRHRRGTTHRAAVFWLRQ